MSDQAFKYRDLRWFETAPDNYVAFGQRQRQWSFSVRHPWLWSLYRGIARLRCLLAGHEWSPLWEEEKFNIHELGKMTTHCVFCGEATDKRGASK